MATSAGMLVAFWALPFLLRLPYTTDMGWEKITQFQHNLFGLAPLWLKALALAGVVASIAARNRTGIILSALGVVCGAAFILAHDTNPEIVLLIEALGEKVPGARWHFSAARLGSAELHLLLLNLGLQRLGKCVADAVACGNDPQAAGVARQRVEPRALAPRQDQRQNLAHVAGLPLAICSPSRAAYSDGSAWERNSSS